MSPTKTRAKKSLGAAQTLTLAPPRLQPAVVGVASPKVGIYAIAVSLSAFLLFQVQLVMGKFILPRFGGGPSVWSTSLLLMFQLLLLAGYGYAAFICARFEPEKQARIHLGLLTVSAAGLAVLAYGWGSPIQRSLTARSTFAERKKGPNHGKIRPGKGRKNSARVPAGT